MRPKLVYADENGEIFDHPGMFMAGTSGGVSREITENQVQPLPQGSELFLLPGRNPLGVDHAGTLVPLLDDPLNPGRPVSAVAAFMAPAHTATMYAAYRTGLNAPNLPLFAYTALGWGDGGFVACGLRVDPSPRQDPGRFPGPERVASQAQRLLRRFEDNSLMQQLGTCALTNACPAARNLMLGRWEAPLPTSPVCNASCLGCLNHQPQGTFPITQERLTTPPSAREVAEVALHHFENGRETLVSFGQGCEGEPLLMGDLLAESISLIRRTEPSGTINLNTNGSLPQVVERLRREGLSSIRVSLNSLIPARHQAYCRPQGWSLSDALDSVRVMKRLGGFVSVNLLTLPGVTDRPEEVEALTALIKETGLDMIQWRNLNIDPQIYLAEMGITPDGEGMGVDKLIKMLRRRFPRLRHGYFNPQL